jgi:transposase-like protein
MSQSAKDQEGLSSGTKAPLLGKFKCEMVQTLLSSTMSLARFAREHELNHNQLARWRREYEQGTYGTVAQAGAESLFPYVSSRWSVAHRWLPLLLERRRLSSFICVRAGS